MTIMLTAVEGRGGNRENQRQRQQVIIINQFDSDNLLFIAPSAIW